jgi:MFS family permease
MMGIGQVLMVSALYDSYGLAGAVAATNGAAWAIGTAILSNMVDRYGQRRIMYPAVFLSCAALAGMVALALVEAPAWTLFPPAIVCGAFGGSPGALARARWNYVTTNPQQLHTAYALESTLDELTFIVGPVAATFLSTTVHPAAGLVAPIVLGLLGAHLFYGQRASEPPIRPHEPIAMAADATWFSRIKAVTQRLILLVPGVGAVVGVNILVGVFFGAIDVSVVAATTAWGARPMSGVVLAVFSVGSALAGFSYGSRSWRSPLANRFLVGIIALLVFGSTLVWAPSPAALAICGFAVGLTVAPTLINGNALIGRLVPARRLTEGLSWMGTSLGIGTALGSSAAGQGIDHGGYRIGFIMVMAAAAIAALIAITSRPALTLALHRVGGPAAFDQPGADPPGTEPGPTSPGLLAPDEDSGPGAGPGAERPDPGP